MSTIRPGANSVFKADGAPPERIFIDGGFAEVNEKGLNILAESATPVSDVDPALVDRDLANAREDVRLAKSPVEADIAEKQAERLAALKQALAAPTAVAMPASTKVSLVGAVRLRADLRSASAKGS